MIRAYQQGNLSYIGYNETEEQKLEMITTIKSIEARRTPSWMSIEMTKNWVYRGSSS